MARISILASLVLASGARAETDNLALTARHSFIVGAYNQSSDVEVGANLAQRPRRGVSLNDLGVDDGYISWLAGYRWRMAPRWSLSANAYINRVTGDQRIGKTFEYGGEVFEAGASLDTRFSVDTYMVDVMYSVWKTDRLDLQVGGGLHVTDLEIEFDARLALGDRDVELVRSSNDLLAPLPNVRLQLIGALSDRWTAYFDAGLLSIEYDDWQGDYVLARVRVDYHFTSHWAAGIGYQVTDLDVDHDRSWGQESYDLRYEGLVFYLAAGF